MALSSDLTGQLGLTIREKKNGKPKTKTRLMPEPITEERACALDASVGEGKRMFL